MRLAVLSPKLLLERILENTMNWLRHQDRVVEIMGDDGKIFMERGYLLFRDRTSRLNTPPRTLPFNILLHKIYRSDPDGFHDHPWPFISFVIKGMHWEQIENFDYPIRRRPTSIAIRNTKIRHRIIVEGGPSWTLVIRGKRRSTTWAKEGINTL